MSYTKINLGMNKKLINILLLIFLISCSNQEEINKSKLSGHDYRLFIDTPAWSLAKAVNSEDTSKIKREVLENKINPDYQESIYGNTLLMMSIYNNDYLSTKTLLALGANPNLRDFHRGSNGVIDAAKSSDSRYLKLILENGGNPNVVENKRVLNDDTPLQTALSSAISYSDPNSFYKIELLIQSGADLNFPEEISDSIEIPIGVAIKRDRMDIALYFLKNGANYRRKMYNMIDGREVYILEALRQCLFELDSHQYDLKMEIVAFLKDKGMNYFSEPIPDYIIKEIEKKYPGNLEEYLMRY